MSDKVDFVKLYKTEKYGQILVVIDEGEKGPEVRFSFVPDGLGVCQQAIQFDGKEGTSDSAWDSAIEFFDLIDEEKAAEFIRPVAEMLKAD